MNRAEHRPSPADARHLPALDGVRGIAVIAVVVFHLGFAATGFMGVDVFFVLSGFLITRILRSEFARTGSIRLPRFTARRLLRLYPALLVVTLFVVVAAVAAAASGNRDALNEVLHDALATLTYTSNVIPMLSGLLDHTWTLSLEEQFYLVWPALLLLALRVGKVWAWLPTVVVLCAVFVFDIVTHGAGAAHTYVRAMGLPLGCLLAFASPAILRVVGYLAVAAAPALIAAFLVPLPSALTTAGPISIGALLAAPVVAAAATWTIRPLEHPVLRWFGLRSYSLYLWHLPLLSIAHHHAPEAVPLWLRLSAGVVASLVAAELSYRFVETPVLRWRDRRGRTVSAVGLPPQ